MARDFSENQTANRFALRVGDSVAFVAYLSSPGAITLQHTEVPPELSGQGVGSKLARATLDEVRTQRGKLRVECDFIRGFVSKHPEYKDLLAD